ncbi:hypothetical protein F5884DRAFT_684657 [Xylogone sp. PMI_703]|nr:hypothetical protein F5884DRAFT_684657 [Xylogone sp. PMI_703]
MLIEPGLKKAADVWEELVAHFNAILYDQDAILDPEAHDRLLFDDETFSRSRWYFWVVDTLEEFIAQIDITLRECQRLFSTDRDQLYDGSGPSASGVQYERKVSATQEEVNRLKDLKSQFEILHRKTMTLRDGLFNASSVIESRESARLGQNVKLLTYVSIFYLPLAFSAAIWSINESYSTSAFAITSILVALGTYFLVANLENLVVKVKYFYGSFKTPIVSRMKLHNETIWKAKGENFSRFSPVREKVKPSEWYILLFLVTEVLSRAKAKIKGALNHFGYQDS